LRAPGGEDEPALVAELRERDPALHARFAHARDSARRIWREPRLRWFTNHTPDNHSRRIVEILSQALEPLQRSREQRLRPTELFLLLAACYLHDIGMQDLRKGDAPTSAFTEREWKLVRDEHPSIVRDWILQRARESKSEEFRIDLGDDPEPYLEILGLVCQGHGSRFFDATVATLDGLAEQFDGFVVRGALLTALLMMGDELEINRLRASVPKDERREPVGILHHTVNSYVTAVRVVDGRTARQRHAVIDASMPEDEELVGLVVEWLGRKLSAQSRRANRVIEPSTNGEVMFDPTVTYRIRLDAAGVRSQLTGRARALLEEEVTGARIVGRGDVVSALKAAARDSGLRGVWLKGDSFGDQGVLLQWLDAHVRALGGLYVRADCADAPGRGPLDLLDVLAGQIPSGAYAAQRRRTDDRKARAPRIAELAAALGDDLLAAAARPCVVELSDLDRASSASRPAVRAFLEALTGEEGPLVLLVMAGEVDTPMPLSVHHLHNLDSGALVDHLVVRDGLEFGPATDLATMLTAATRGGTPVDVHNALRTREARDRDIVRV
jgi:hypothetical protein